MNEETKRSIKDKVKAKAKAVKEKLKGAAKRAAPAAGALALCALAGCMTPEQASRSTKADVGDVEPTVKVEFGEGCASNSVSVVVRTTFGDGAIASADSSGSTESQTQTPTFDISPKTDVRYNDAIAAASTTSRGILEPLGSVLTDAGKASLLAMVESKSTGTVTLDKKDGTQTVVKCVGGQCTECTDCSPSK